MDEMNNQAPAGKNALAIAGMVVGIVSIFLGFYCITGIVGLILSILGLKKSKETGKGKGMAIAGIVCSIVGIVVTIIGLIIAAVAAKALNEGLNSLNTSLNNLNSLNSYINSLY